MDINLLVVGEGVGEVTVDIKKSNCSLLQYDVVQQMWTKEPDVTFREHKRPFGAQVLEHKNREADKLHSMTQNWFCSGEISQVVKSLPICWWQVTQSKMTTDRYKVYFLIYPACMVDMQQLI